jgi:glycosyltransferase involved in cell wall biosynthesis
MTRIALVTNLPTHYRTPMFERLAIRATVDFYFTSSGHEWYWPPAAQLSTGELRAVRDPRPFRLALHLLRGNYDCIVASLVGRLSLVGVVLVAKLTRTPLVIWVGIWQHPQTRFHRFSRPAARWIYRHADAVLVYGPHVRDFIERESGRTENVIELPQAVDNDAFRTPKPAARVATIRRDIGSDAKVVGCFIGRLDEGKGLETLVEALALTKVPQAIALVGRGKLQGSIKGLAEAGGVSNRLQFPGYIPQENLPVVLQAADYLVLPSVTTRRFKECWGLVINEAMNSGLPAIATDAVGAVPGGLLIDGVTGLVVPEGDPVALAAAMDALAGDADLRRRLAARASEHVLHWNFDAGVDALLRAVEEATGRQGVVVASSAGA